MTKKGETLKVFDEYVTKMMEEKWCQIQTAIDKLPEKGNIDDIGELLVEANSWLSLICGDNEELYEDWRYRLFQTADNKLIVVRGKEIDVDFRAWMNQPNE